MVCTGNVCRSPYAEAQLGAALPAGAVRVRSLGVRAPRGAPIAPEVLRLLADRGIDPGAAAEHRARRLDASALGTPDLVLTATRDHRRSVVELAPRLLQRTFTLREFGRLAAAVAPDELADAIRRSGAADAMTVVRRLVASRRPSSTPARDIDDDVVDPVSGPWQLFEECAAQMDPALSQVIRIFDAVRAFSDPIDG